MYLPADCLSLYQDGENTDGVYTLQPSPVTSFPAFCDMQTGGWTVIQRRVDDTVDFYRTFAEYEAGFGDPAGNVWIGLTALHQLSLLPGTMEMEVYVESASTSWKGTAKYGDVFVDGAQQNYRLSISGFSNMGTGIMDCVSGANDAEFSTWDNDNDLVVGQNCAHKFTGAWWYGISCGFANLNGHYNDTFKWYHGSVMHLMKFSEMKIRHDTPL